MKSRRIPTANSSVTAETPTPDELLSSVPDWDCTSGLRSFEKAAQWIQEGREKKIEYSDQFVSLQWGEWGQIKDSRDQNEDVENLFGYYASEKWRKFVLAVFLADLVSYPGLPTVTPGIPSKSTMVDQVNFDRLLFVMHGFPKGFRVWWLKQPDAQWWPVGYTGWYPMSETLFEVFQNRPDRLNDRLVPPVVPHVVPQVVLPPIVPPGTNMGALDSDNRASDPLLYLFNYSVAPALKKTPLSKALMLKYSEDLRSRQYQGLACITVSEDGSRIAKRFGMSCSGSLTLQGSREDVFVFKR